MRLVVSWLKSYGLSNIHFFVDICSLQPETGLCKAYFPSYYWNVVTRQCEQFVYGGCGGNLNRFSDIESCRNQCGKL